MSGWLGSIFLLTVSVFFPFSPHSLTVSVFPPFCTKSGCSSVSKLLLLFCSRPAPV